MEKDKNRDQALFVIAVSTIFGVGIGVLSHPTDLHWGYKAATLFLFKVCYFGLASLVLMMAVVYAWHRIRKPILARRQQALRSRIEQSVTTGGYRVAAMGKSDLDEPGHNRLKDLQRATHDPLLREYCEVADELDAAKKAIREF